VHGIEGAAEAVIGLPWPLDEENRLIKDLLAGGASSGRMPLNTPAASGLIVTSTTNLNLLPGSP
jgi:hypothetical protein